MANVFNVYGRLKLDLRDFKTSLNEASRRIGSFARYADKSFKGLSGTFGRLGKDMLVLGGAATAGLGFAFKRLIDQGSQINDLSAQLGMSTRAFSELSYAASLSGIQMEDLAKSIGKMQRFLADSQSRSILRKLGLDPETLRQASPEDAFTTIIDALGKLKEQNVRMDLVSSIFGKGGGNLLRLAKDGAAGINLMREQARKLGLSISEKMAADMDEMGDNLDTIQASVGTLGRMLMTTLIPSIKATMEVLAGWIDKIIKFRENHETWFNGIAKFGLGILILNTALGLLFFGLSNVFDAMSVGFGTIKSLAKWIEKLTTAKKAAAGASTALAAAQTAEAGAATTAASANSFFTISLGPLLWAIGLVSLAIGLLVSKDFRNYVRSIGIVRAATDAFFLSASDGWATFSHGLEAGFVVIAFKIKDLMLSLGSWILGYFADMIDKINVFNSKKLTVVANAVRLGAGMIEQNRSSNLAEYNRSIADRRYAYRRDMQGNYDAVFGSQSSTNQKGEDPFSDPAFQQSNQQMVELQRQNVELQRRNNELMQQLINTFGFKPGTTQMPVGLY